MAANEALIRAYDNQSEAIRRKVLLYVMAVWDSSTSYRTEDVDRIVRQIVPAVQAGQLQMAALTDAYIGQVAKVSGVSWTPFIERSVVTYRGVDSGVVYRRPAVEVYTALAKGESFAEAVQFGANRLQSLASTDMQQARNRQAASSVGRSGFTLFRRVLSGKEDCALCAIASTHTYSRGDLMPIHPGCDCGVEPLSSPAEFQGASEVALRDIQADIAGRLDHAAVDSGARDLGLGKTASSGAPVSDYTDLIVSRDHGEYGPTLSWRSQQFTSEADISALQ